MPDDAQQPDRNDKQPATPERPPKKLKRIQFKPGATAQEIAGALQAHERQRIAKWGQNAT